MGTKSNLSPAALLARQKKRPYTRSHPVAGRTGSFIRVHVCLVREQREALGLSIRDVCKATGISYPIMWRTEMGAEASLSVSRKLADFFGVPEATLWQRLE